MTMQIVEIRNPVAWEIPFVQRAVRSIKCVPDDLDFAAVLDAYEVLAVMAPRPSALAILSFQNGPLNSIPSVVHFYSEGTSEARTALIERVVERIKEEGFTHYLAGNWSHGEDAAWCRLFRNGGSFEKVGSTFIGEVP